MINTPKDFLAKHRDGLIQIVQAYLDASVSFTELQEYGWDIIDDWEFLNEKAKKQKYTTGEKAFWAVVWEIVFAPDEEHLESSQKDLRLQLECFTSMKDLPKDFDARRP